jgi:hypothetical protein
MSVVEPRPTTEAVTYPRWWRWPRTLPQWLLSIALAQITNAVLASITLG